MDKLIFDCCISLSVYMNEKQNKKYYFEIQISKTQRSKYSNPNGHPTVKIIYLTVIYYFHVREHNDMILSIKKRNNTRN